MPGALVLINGFPAVGKHTVARELTTLLPDCRFFDTRTLVTAASQLFSPSDAAHSLLRKNLKHAIFTSLTPTRTIYVLTDFLSVAARPSDRDMMAEFIAFAQSSGFAFIHVILGCSTDENVRRLACQAREREREEEPKGEGHGGRDGDREGDGERMDAAALLEIRMEEEIGHMAPLAGLVGEFELDTTGIDAKTTAGVLAEYSLDVLRAAGWWIQLNGASAASAFSPSGTGVDATTSAIYEPHERDNDESNTAKLSQNKRSPDKFGRSLGLRKSFSAR
ncbi:hypothetical protein CspeluHIS016_0308540 [Cutaneotrichosporon spelunceum]|uniref:P-loop containing nucleoside triphosphate hydrolase protein n=1 Tax=Cutaneotrichosporon spelunceum TaxID=1672016 RepID=A0AAD3TUD7_9TREE|nr:hypothetical protein CspeluHIS016_0308540 [Cutaneotrichosporon spelunceum]